VCCTTSAPSHPPASSGSNPPLPSPIGEAKRCVKKWAHGTDMPRTQSRLPQHQKNRPNNLTLVRHPNSLQLSSLPPIKGLSLYQRSLYQRISAFCVAHFLNSLLGPKGRYIIAQVEGLGFVTISRHGLKGRFNCGNFSDSTFQALRTSGTHPGLRPGLK